jgi:uncharacterized protein YuzE
MYPRIDYDKNNGLAYLAFSDHEVERSIESEDELLVFDLDQQENLVGIEIMSIERLLQQSNLLLGPNPVSPEMLSVFLIPHLFQYAKQQRARRV